ncbi:MAG: hypothetical protein HDQ88_01390, partial [Clostridia bacterium]|nr:hypothetical protein [Clostridia bacterium]
MSQTLLSNQPVPAAFQNPPSMAAAAKASVARAYDAPASAENQTTAQPVQPQPATPIGVEPIRIPAPAQQRPGVTVTPPAQAPRPAEQQDTPTTGHPAQTPNPVAPPVHADDVQLQRQLAAERQLWAQREQQYQQAFAAQQQQLQAMQDAQAELETYRQREALQQQLSNDELFAGLETIDADEARRLMALTANVLQQPINEVRADIARQREELARQQQYVQQQLQLAQSEHVRRELLNAHPDFLDLYNGNPAFRQYLSEREGLSSRTREEMMKDEYNAGNAAYVIDVVKRFKDGTPRVNDIQAVPPVQVANAAAAPAPSAQAAPRYTIAELNSLAQQRLISQDQYRLEKEK